MVLSAKPAQLEEKNAASVGRLRVDVDKTLEADADEPHASRNLRYEWKAQREAGVVIVRAVKEADCGKTGGDDNRE